ncbi:MAG: LysM peptidoglycan-binding domain-containing protein, partial [Chloroflexi bacterium]|nr:LysM peptidoglycan-binding domain-containing protein [Chloroflexota bacterium]
MIQRGLGRGMLTLCGLGLLLTLASVNAQDTPAAERDTPIPSITIHVVQRGETLYGVAQQYNVGMVALAQLNGIVNPATIQVGQRLLVPADRRTDDDQVVHIVQPGETVESISALYGLNADVLAARNNLGTGRNVYIGQRLNVAPDAAPPPEAAADPKDDLRVAAAQVVWHTVQPGETLLQIAGLYDVSVDVLIEGNNILDPETIYADQRLAVAGITAPQLAIDLPSLVTDLDIAPLLFIEGQTGRFRLTTLRPVQVSGSFLGREVVAAAEDDGLVNTILVGVPVGTRAGVY